MTIRMVVACLVVLSGCADRRAVRLSPEHVPPQISQAEYDPATRVAEDAPVSLQPIGGGQVADTVQAMNAEHGTLGDPERHDFHDLGIETRAQLQDALSDAGFAGRPADLVEAAPPSDWAHFTERRYARGSSLDWIPVGSCPVCQPVPAPTATATVRLRRVPLVTPDDAIVSVLVPPLDGQGVVFPFGSAGAVCVDDLVKGVSVRRCTTVEALRRVLHER